MNILPEEAVKAAAQCYLDRTVSINETASSLARAMLTAALPFLPVQVAVKKLEWKYVERAVMTYVTSDDRGMLYYINQSFGSDSYYFATVRYSDGTVLYDGDDLPSAKAAAQADFEARILSALEPTAARFPCDPTEEMVDAALAVDWENEDERATVINIWHAMTTKLPTLQPSAARELVLYEGDDICSRLKGLASWLDSSQHSKWCGRKEVPIHGYSGEGKLVRAAIAAIRALSSPDHAGAFPQSKNEGRLSELNVEPGEVFERISGHDRHSDNLIGAKYISKDTGPYCQRGLHLERIPSGTGWTTMDDRGIFRRLSCDAGKVEGDGIERGKFYHHQWPMERLLEARRDGLVDHSGGEAWRYEYSHKDEHGKYDILYRPVKITTIPARLPSALSEGAE